MELSNETAVSIGGAVATGIALLWAWLRRKKIIPSLTTPSERQVAKPIETLGPITPAVHPRRTTITPKPVEQQPNHTPHAIVETVKQTIQHTPHPVSVTPAPVPTAAPKPKAVKQKAPSTMGLDPTKKPVRPETQDTKALGLLPGSHRKKYETGWFEQQHKESEAVKKAKERLAQVRKAEAQVTAAKPSQQSDDLEYEFTGSSLVIGDRPYITGLANKKHRLEITSDGQCYVDGTPQRINAGDLAYIRRALRGGK